MKSKQKSRTDSKQYSYNPSFSSYEQMEETDVSFSSSIQSFIKPIGSEKGLFQQKPTRVLSIDKGHDLAQSVDNDPEMNSLLNPNNILMINNRPYLKLKQIGKGGSSTVYKVLSLDSEIYAVKEVNISLSDKYIVDSFINEIQLLQILQTSNRIIKLIDSEVNINEGKIFIILELGDIDLASLIAKNRLENEDVDPNFLRIIWQEMLEAVSAVHSANVVHGDLKPANFLFAGGTLKLIDFGIAKSISPYDDTTSIERAHQVGTINYMSPESLQKRPIDAHKGGRIRQGRPADVWSLGCILYQLVYNRPPFPQQELFQKISAICDPKYKIEFPFVDRPDIVPLLDVMKSCLIRDPKKRPKIKDLLDHPYLTLRQVELENDLLTFIDSIQENFLDFDFDSVKGKRVLKRLENRLLNSEPLSIEECIEEENYHN
ncbi:Pkinase-domain-containing protein [Histomonas meleagridis]|uniref:Pkinase-domain-containing protein n=1 Tax=Histomonas meleagridis TaxID=135588 RepID=UPI00355A83D6|nr:Pkinase-domain-containing protein [Histomonas meleagridis]KAH0801120.1 Pkinase-domain-containing protein [Histomonas meleagridis]